ncbi:ABC transporter permease [Paenibacillus radicis (ex Gao et al. 2016)]|uniref:ABC transporter permease n=1 Tax=Paenibacillus radicis (ex Gao et al. 2016) TaxID=1737354 RepID=A0A917H1G9_9BACL|nr:ABC-2 family transporter protein [Paenibacillus radicis (ex Gao et al. 2016)]GGG64400.1 ABC transporter permease [Paenibacillus radicis (ex Gao et al. 2016)]
MRYLKLYARFIPIYFKSKTEHGFGFYMDFVGFALSHIVSYAVIWALMSRFQTINGWNMYEVMIIYTLNMLTYAIAAVFFFFQMNDVEEDVHKGSFDSLLVKPINPFIHMIIRSFGHFFLGDIVIAILMLGFCFSRLDLHPNLAAYAGFVALLLGAVLIQAAFIVITGSMCFWIVRARAVMNVVIFGIRGFADYPISIYSKVLRVILTFIIPYGFVNFYPSQLILDKEGGSLFVSWLPYATPVVGLILFFIAYRVWNAGLNRYQGTGS